MVPSSTENWFGVLSEFHDPEVLENLNENVSFWACHFKNVFFVTGEIGLASFHPQKGCFLSGSCTARAVEEGTTVMWLLTTALSVKINKMSLYLQQPITACQIFNQPISTQYRICDLSWCHTSPEQTDKSTCPDDFGSCCCLYTEILFIYLTVD